MGVKRVHCRQKHDGEAGETVQEPPLISLFGKGPVNPERSAQMAKIRGRDTKPELMLRRAVWRLGGRFRTHVHGLPGRPDLANRRAKVVAFVDGCFWHGCPAHFKAPKTRNAFWVEKIARNQRTRTRVLAEYPADWKVVQVFECAIAQDLDRIAEELAKDLLRTSE